ncbi:c2 domain containing protein [Grosmannia clavigera kw1407]|uniref:C2 domain containing protein n=1 Tax=Grosmannia clavigera (strain kw1407 / UAMH 11150) TaxID=655863 RepID=F0XQZ5_GROCL|nr:c2 domain containing protein [Grosmannia clavigera kw1407]EFW99692.1 c2 domain containing protein [Grosmannia clavigera kw1407]
MDALSPANNEKHDNEIKHSRASKVKEKLTEKKDKATGKANPPGGYDATPLPDLQPGYTVKFTFHKALNLPVSDINTSSADPYIKATLTTDIPKRHKEDPELIHRTKTVHKSTEPVWDEKWVVAHVPASGFRLKCRIYDEDPSDHDDRLGNVTIEFSTIIRSWKDLDHTKFDVKKRAGSKRAYMLRGAASIFRSCTSITPILELSIEVLGKSEGLGGRVYTLGPTTWIRHFSPMIGRLTGTRVNKDERQDEDDPEDNNNEKDGKGTKKYDFQANEIQLQGPVPVQLYHRYVEFRPIIGRMFSSRGLSGWVLNKALHKQHSRVYRYDAATEYGNFEPFSEEATLQFLKLAHFSEGGRIFTYIITLDGMMRFTETGKEFGIDMLSKHTMHSDVATYIAFSGEFFVRRLSEPTVAAGPKLDQQAEVIESQATDGVAKESSPQLNARYQLIIDNDSGTYRPSKEMLPFLKDFLMRNFSGLKVTASHWEDEAHQKIKKAQLERKKKEGPGVQMVLNRSPSASSFSSSDESRLSGMGRSNAMGHRGKSNKEIAWDLMEKPGRIKDMAGIRGHRLCDEDEGQSSTQANGIS